MALSMVFTELTEIYLLERLTPLGLLQIHCLLLTLEPVCRVNICGNHVLPVRQLDNLNVHGRCVCQNKCLLTAMINPLSRPNSLSG